MADESLTLEQVRARAKERLKGVCMVYKDCDGDPSKFCQRQHYGGPLGIGGVGSGAAFRNNWLALRDVTLKMRIVTDHADPDTSFDCFGRTLAMPVMAAPVSGVNSFGGEDVITEQAFCDAVVQGCNAAGAMGWRGDSFNYALDAAHGVDAIARGGQGGIQIIKPRAQNVIMEFFKMAEGAGATAVGVDVDGCGSVMMNTHAKKVFRKSQADLEALAQSTPLPFIVKGVMCAEDAVAAADAGAAGIVVSNHGGRVLDHTPGTAAVLPAIADALKGRAVTVFADGGVRTGYDVLKMLALGADGVLVGRDIVRAAVGAGAEGVALQMQTLQMSLAKAMLMTGCDTLAEVSDHVLAG